MRVPVFDLNGPFLKSLAYLVLLSPYVWLAATLLFLKLTHICEAGLGKLLGKTLLQYIVYVLYYREINAFDASYLISNPNSLLAIENKLLAIASNFSGG